MMTSTFRSLAAGSTKMVRAVPRASVVTTSVAVSSTAVARSAAVVNHATAARAGAPSVGRQPIIIKAVIDATFIAIEPDNVQCEFFS
jgi:hypothetical protein